MQTNYRKLYSVVDNLKAGNFNILFNRSCLYDFLFKKKMSLSIK